MRALRKDRSGGAARSEKRDASRGGLTDAEWLDSLRAEGRLPENLTRGFEELFTECESVKYAGRAPTEWALEETFGRVRRTLEALRTGERVA